MKDKAQLYSKGVFLNIFSKEKKSWKEQINFIDSLPNVNHVEVWIEEDLNRSEIKFLKSILKNYNIIIHGPFVHLSLISPHQEIREITIKRYLQTLKVAEILGAKLVTLHAGNKIKFLPQGQAIKILTSNLRKLKKNYKGKIPFTIENLPPQSGGVRNHYPGSLKDLSYLKKMLPWINFTVDIGHAFQSGENLDKISNFLRKYKNSILDIHLHDATLNRKAHLALGKGELNLNKFSRLLKKINYNKYISLETVTKKDTYNSWRKITNPRTVRRGRRCRARI
jgi:sugar phosphate isomerase/epimerase